MPGMLASQPKLLADAQPFFQAFCRLQGSRVASQGGVMPIPMSEIRAYFDVYAIVDLDMRSQYVKMLGACDKAYLEAQEKKSGAGNKPPGGRGFKAGRAGRPPSARRT